MEFPELANACSFSGCKEKNDFLPFKCDGCTKTFCLAHHRHENHSCPVKPREDRYCPVCPLCKQAVPIKGSADANLVMDRHIKAGCPKPVIQTAKTVCSKPGCKEKEFVPVSCKLCKKPFCLKHRFETDHDCSAKKAPQSSKLPLSDKSKGQRPASSSSASAKKPSNGARPTVARALATSAGHAAASVVGNPGRPAQAPAIRSYTQTGTSVIATKQTSTSQRSTKPIAAARSHGAATSSTPSSLASRTSTAATSSTNIPTAVRRPATAAGGNTLVPKAGRPAQTRAAAPLPMHLPNQPIGQPWQQCVVQPNPAMPGQQVVFSLDGLPVLAPGAQPLGQQSQPIVARPPHSTQTAYYPGQFQPR